MRRALALACFTLLAVPAWAEVSLVHSDHDSLSIGAMAQLAARNAPPRQ